ncbi:MAG: hypothetical protein WC657_09450 [Candidatus Paceibacterota bacterium]|jgi:hypothetical protein
MGQSSVVTHDFRNSLAYSEVASDEPFWSAVYKKAFPNIVNQMLASGDTASQRMGIDRVVILANGQILKIDEKKRAGTYQDILLEYISVDTTGAPGWMEKDLAIDYLAYAFMPTKKVYLFSWPILRRAWDHYKAKWIATYPKITAQNRGYKTISVAVPIDVLTAAVSAASVIQL